MVSAVFQKHHNREKTWTIINYVNIGLTIIASVTESESQPYENLLNDFMAMNKVTIFHNAEKE